MKLNDRKWKSFDLSGEKGIFKNFHGKRLTKDKRIKGKIPLLTAGEQNNGVADFISNSNMLGYKNFISIDMFGNAFFHKYFSFGDDNIYFFLNDNISKCCKLFIVNSINKNRSKFSYGKQFRQRNADSLKIMLPVSKTDESIPDWHFMESFIKEKYQNKEKKYREYINKIIDELEHKDIEDLKEKEWKEFNLQKLFISQKGNQNNMSDLKSGNIPLVSAKNGANGIKDFVSKNDKNEFNKNCLTLNNDGDGGAGLSYYQPFNFLLDSHVTALYSKETLSKYTLLFISRCITKQRDKFGHGYSINNNRLRIFKIMLPINKNNQPDFDYMEQYIKNMMLKKYKQYFNK